MGGGGGKVLGENGVMKKEEDRCGKKVELREKKKKNIVHDDFFLDGVGALKMVGALVQ